MMIRTGKTHLSQKQPLPDHYLVPDFSAIVATIALYSDPLPDMC